MDPYPSIRQYVAKAHTNGAWDGVVTYNYSVFLLYLPSKHGSGKRHSYIQIYLMSESKSIAYTDRSNYCRMDQLFSARISDP